MYCLSRFCFLPLTSNANCSQAERRLVSSTTAETRAIRARERLHRYRGAVLRAAVRGELTRSWREAQRKNKKANIETGETLLREFLAVRRNRWEEAELRLLQERHKAPRNDQWKSRYAEPARPSTADLPKVPETWAWASLEMIAEIGSGISVSQNRRVENPVELPYLRVANVLRGYLDLSEIKTIRVEKDRIADYLLRVGDILFTEGGRQRQTWTGMDMGRPNPKMHPSESRLPCSTDCSFTGES